LDTTTVTTSGLTRLTVSFYTVQVSRLGNSYSYLLNQSIPIYIDNVYPTAQILSVNYVVNGQTIPQSPCTIVQGTGTTFQFQITALDPDQHLSSINFYSIWGNDQSGTIYSDSYNNHIPNPDNGVWGGPPANILVPSTPWNAWVQGDNTSIQCAHSFSLNVWDRAINGNYFIHSASYTQSLTLLLQL